MKYFAILIILTGFGLAGANFFGLYTARGLENFPTLESVGKKGTKERTKKADSGARGKQSPGPVPGRGPFPANSKGKVSERNKYLNENKHKIAPGG